MREIDRIQRRPRRELNRLMLFDQPACILWVLDHPRRAPPQQLTLQQLLLNHLDIDIIGERVGGWRRENSFAELRH